MVSPEPFKIAVIGCGYVGSVTAACFSHLGYSVLGVEKESSRLASLQAGKAPVYEPYLQELVEAGVRAGRLAVTSDVEEAVRDCLILFLCVGTPPGPNGAADLSQVGEVALQLGKALVQYGEYRVIVNKSTVPVGSGDWVAMLVCEGARQQGRQVQPGRDFDVVSNPEFLREGTAVTDSLFPDRIVIGTRSQQALELMRTLYAPLLEGEVPPVEGLQRPGKRPEWVATDLTTAEMIKYAANAFLAARISLINEIASICEKVGADVRVVARGIGLDHRIGPYFLKAGIGWGGSCFGKDLKALIHEAENYGCPTPILRATLEVNDRQRAWVVGKLQERLRMLKGRTIALWGLAFKPDTDDCRDAPALSIARRLLDLGARLQAYDPQAMENARQLLPSMVYCRDLYQACRGADALVLSTEWREFLQADFSEVARVMRGRLVIDGRNALPTSQLKELGFEVIGVGW